MSWITPQWAIVVFGMLALFGAIPILVQGLRRRGTSETYEPLFWIQRAPQLAVLLNVLLILGGFELSHQRLPNLFAHVPSVVSSLVAWCGVVLYVSGLTFLLGGWYSLGANFSTDAELLRGQTLTIHGFYRVVLHPVYSGATQMLFGAGLASGSLIAVVFTVVVVVPLGFRRSRYEEALLVKRFGEEYERYAASIGWRRLVPRFVPFGF